MNREQVHTKHQETGTDLVSVHANSCARAICVTASLPVSNFISEHFVDYWILTKMYVSRYEGTQGKEGEGMAVVDKGRNGSDTGGSWVGTYSLRGMIDDCLTMA